MYQQQLQRLLAKLSLEDVENALRYLYLENQPLPKRKRLRGLSTLEWGMLQILLVDLLLEKEEARLH